MAAKQDCCEGIELEHLHNQKTGIRILFQGDSVTDAFRKPDELNPAFQVGNGYVFLIAARLAANYPDQRFEFINRAVSGNCIQDLAGRWQKDALDLQVDILSLLVGVNNILRRGNGGSDIPDRELLVDYRQLLERMREQNPCLPLILLEPYLLEVGEITATRKTMLQPIQQGIAQVADEFGAIFIPLQQIFDDALRSAPASYWAYDGIHATHAGFYLIADAWLKAVASHRLLSTSYGNEF